MLKYSPVNGLPTLPSQVTGTALAYFLRGKSEDERAALAAQWGPTGILSDLTDKQFCSVFGITAVQLTKARDPDGQRRLERLMRSCGTDVAWER